MKKRFLILVCLLILSSLLYLGYYFYKEYIRINSIVYPVLDSYLVDYDDTGYPYDGMISVKKDDKLGFINYYGKELIPFKYNYEDNSFVHFVGEYVVINDDSKYTLVNKNGKELLIKYDLITLTKYNNKTYVIASLNEKTYVYDNSLNLIIQLDVSSAYIDDGYIVSYNEESIVYNLNGEFITKGNLCYSNKYFFVLEDNDKYFIYYKSINKLTKSIYLNYSINNDLILLKYNDTYVTYNSLGKKIKEYQLNFDNLNIINDDFFSSSDGCENNLENQEIDFKQKVYDSLGNLIVNECSYIYKLENNDFMSINDDIKYYKNGELFKVYKDYSYVGYSDKKFFTLDQYKDEQYSLTVFDINGEKVLDKISGFYKLNEYYYIQYPNMLYEVYDKDLNKVTKKYYTNISYYDNMFVYSDIKDKYGIYDRNFNSLIDSKYDDCKSNDNISICSYKGKYEINIVNYLTKKEKEATTINTINYDDKYDIDLDKIISDYELESIKSYIKEDEEYFKKYAYNVINNDKINDFKKNVLNLYKIVYLNSKYIDKEALLNNLKKLSIDFYETKPSFMLNYAVGEYLNSETRIVLVDKSDRVVYHELLHFLQYNKNRVYNNTGNKVYECNDNYYTIIDMMKLEDSIIKQCKSLYTGSLVSIEEASAEIFANEYYTDGIPKVYYKQVQIYEAFKYLFGKDVMDEISFSALRNSLLFIEINKYIDFNIEQYRDFISNLNNINQADIKYDTSVEQLYSLYKVSDLLIDLYKSIKGDNWKNDILFTTLLDELIHSNVNIYNYIINNYIKNNNKTIKYLNDYSDIKIKDLSNFYVYNNMILVYSTHKDFLNNSIIYRGYNMSNYDFKYYIEYYDINNNLIQSITKGNVN